MSIASRIHATLFGATIVMALSSGWTPSASGQEPDSRRTVRAAAPVAPVAEDIPQELRLTPEQEQTAALLLAPNRRKDASAIADLLREGRPFAEVRPRWEALVRQTGWAGVTDPTALVMWVLREAYREQTVDLRHYAEKVRYLNTMKSLIRDELVRARSVLASERSERIAYVPDPRLRPPPLSGTPRTATLTTAAEVREAIAQWEEDLNTIGDDSQLANVDLQNTLQKQQQMLQMLSNISKQLHDTAMSVIRNMRA
jgi:hypothetical protein